MCNSTKIFLIDTVVDSIIDSTTLDDEREQSPQASTDKYVDYKNSSLHLYLFTIIYYTKKTLVVVKIII